MKSDLTPEEIKEAIEHRDVKLAIQAVLATISGREFIKYLFKHYGVGELPELGLQGDFLMDKLGYLRAGNAIFKLVCEANAEMAATLLAQVEKERHEKIYAATLTDYDPESGD